jgi:hypothetical protein
MSLRFSKAHTDKVLMHTNASPKREQNSLWHFPTEQVSRCTLRRWTQVTFFRAGILPGPESSVFSEPECEHGSILEENTGKPCAYRVAGTPFFFAVMIPSQLPQMKSQSVTFLEVLGIKMGAPGRVELPTDGLGNRCSIHLSYGAKRATHYLTRISSSRDWWAACRGHNRLGRRDATVDL